MCRGVAEIRVQFRLEPGGGEPDPGLHGRDCLCGGALTGEECDRRVTAIWTLINQRAELARQLAGRPRAAVTVAASRQAWRSTLALHG